MTSWHGNDFCITGPLWGESDGFPLYYENFTLSSLLEQNIEQTIDKPVIWEIVARMWRHCHGNVVCNWRPWVFKADCVYDSMFFEPKYVYNCDFKPWIIISVVSLIGMKPGAYFTKRDQLRFSHG